MSRPQTVLIIEDDPLLRLTLTACLGDSGLIVLKPDGGLERLEACTSALPDIILTDLRMPVPDGFDVIARHQETEFRKAGHRLHGHRRTASGGRRAPP